MSDPAIETIDDVLAALDRVLDRAIREHDREGFFAAIYRQVTAKVKEGVEAGFFDDAERMARLDVAFASRYLSALDAYDRGATLTRSWRAAFDAGDAWRPIVLQHLLLGVNAHINLDLGIVAAEVAPGADLPGLRLDFDRINEILASLLRRVADGVGDVSPWIRLLDGIGGRHDDVMIRFSIEVARSAAWRFAAELAPLPRHAWGGPIGARDAIIARLAGAVLNPRPLAVGLLLIRLRETNDVARVIEALQRVPPPDLAAVEAAVRKERAGD